MANKNYVLLERVTVGEAGASSITFNSIPQTGYTDLKVVASTRYSTAISMGGMSIYLNTVTTNQSGKYLLGNGSAASSSGSILLDSTGASDTASTFASWEIYFPNYTSSNFKSFSIEGAAESNVVAAEVYLSAGLWSSTAAITSIGFARTSASYAQYSTFSLYGLAAVGTTPTKAPKASGGSIIQTDGTYWYHAFLASGTFTPATKLSCDVLVVAGGGAGGGQNAGGGGAGGFLTFTSQSLTAQNYTCTIGAGGTSVYQGSTTNGVNSSFGALTVAVGGGAGGFFWGGGSGNAQSGGSGGGAGGVGGILKTGGAGTSGQGNNGGNCLVNDYAGGGGGGANAVGTTVTLSERGGAGGAGSSTAISGGSTTGLGQLSGGVYYFAGGGGGAGNVVQGAGGLGGGGESSGVANTGSGTAGTANTGGGGGGARGGFAGGKGGSGIVIVRYLA